MFYADVDAGADGAPLQAQPVSLHYAPRPGLPKSFYGWWGRMALFSHIWDVTSLSSSGVVTVVFHEPVSPAEAADRKTLAATAQRMVDEGRAQSALDASEAAG